MANKFKKINSLILLTAIILSFVVSFIPQKVNALDWYNTLWLYRKSISINGTTAGIQINYQLPIYVYYTSGVDTPLLNAEPTAGTYIADASTNATQIVDAALTSATTGYYVGRTIYNITRNLSGTITAYNGATKTATCTSIAGQVATDVYVIQKQQAKVYMGNKCQTDFEDLRFTKSDGITLLDYWKEEYVASNYAIVWVEFDYIVASPSQQTFYVYYGNSTATSVSSGANTFILFDDFERGANGDTIGGSWTEQTAHVHISTEQYYGGTRSAKLVGNTGVQPKASIPLTFSANQEIHYRFYKETAAVFTITHGSAGEAWYLYTRATELMVYIDAAPAEVTTGVSCVPDIWQKVSVYNWSTNNDTARFKLNNSVIGTLGDNYGTVAYNDEFRLIAGNGFGTASLTNEDVWVDNVFVTNRQNVEPAIADWGSEEYFSIGSYLSIQDVKVFESYRGAGDWIFTIRYLNLYPPYYDTYDIRKLFVFQLRDLTGTVRSQAPLIAWGNRVGNLYMAASEVGALDYGENYVIRIYGLFGSNPYVDYTLQDSDWQGSDLTNLDSWVVSSASVISDYYSTDLTSYNAQRGEVLNATGATIFDQGINGLSKVRPDIFESSSGQGGYTDKTHTQTGRVNDWATAVGPDFAAWFGNIGGIVGQDGLFAIRLICIIFFFVIQMYCCIPNHNIAANVLGVPFIAGLWYFGLEIIWVAMLAIIAAGLFALQFWIHK